jgi:hypothetical protein
VIIEGKWPFPQKFPSPRKLQWLKPLTKNLCQLELNTCRWECAEKNFCLLMTHILVEDKHIGALHEPQTQTLVGAGNEIEAPQDHDLAL